MPTCTNGHESDTTDYCSICGEAFGVPGEPPLPSTPEPAAEESVSGAEAETPSGPGCPNCDAGRSVDDVFCESCGYDFLTGTAPEAVATAAGGGAAAAPAVAAPVAPAPDGALTEATLVAVIDCDDVYYGRTAADSDLAFPDPLPEPVRLPLQGEVLIGRRSESRGVYPEIDSLSTSGDPAVSSRHAILRTAADGTTVLVDVGSTNGTYLDGATDPIAQGVEVPVAEGTIIHVGAWTRIVVAVSDPATR